MRGIANRQTNQSAALAINGGRFCFGSRHLRLAM